jgi:hypothetical protein
MLASLSGQKISHKRASQKWEVSGIVGLVSRERAPITPGKVPKPDRTLKTQSHTTRGCTANSGWHTDSQSTERTQ